MPTVHEFLAQAQQAQQAGDSDRAETICRHILAHAPDSGDAWRLLGSLCVAGGRHEEAVAHLIKAAQLLPEVSDVHFDLGQAYHALAAWPAAEAAFRRALKLAPSNASIHANLGAILQAQDKLDEATAFYRRALDLKPDFAEVWANLAAVSHQQGQLDGATAHYRRAIEHQPAAAKLHALLGLVLQDQSRFDDAISSFQQSLALDPQQAELFNNLGVLYQNRGRPVEALAAYEQALQLCSGYAKALNNRGVMCQNSDELEKSAVCFRRALEFKSQFAETLNNLAVSLQYQGKLDEAAQALEQAISQEPHFSDAHCNLGNVRKDQGRLDEAIACYRRALTENPQSRTAHSNLCFVLQYCPGVSAAEILAEHQRWNERHAAELEREIQPHANDPTPNRRLRIGYVSPDFCNHVLTLFTKPLLSNHNHRDFEIFCYSDVPSPDDFTDRLKPYSDHWRDIRSLTDSQAASLIRADQIDILIDLAMHQKRTRLLVFARRSAPVQICWIAYPGTTGLTSIDYRLTDPYLDPPGLFDHFYSEESIRLPDTFWCYDPLVPELAVNALPALASGHITFGSLNNFCKINDGTLELFTRVLQVVKNSRLMLLVGEGSHRDRTREFFVQRDIAVDRLTFVSRQPRLRFSEQYHEIDIGLDTFPYNGHTTSLDALWMGVPVVTLVGDTVVGRAGLSQLTNLSLTDLVAHTPDEYVEIVARLASNLTFLVELRATLRSRMQNSPLMNAPLFTRNMEHTYRTLFRRWCEKRLSCPGSSLGTH